MVNKTHYISLQEATKYCDYSQEYLSLRARQGKLKAIKIGRNWATREEWVKEYLKTFNGQKVEEIRESRKAGPPENLPIETSAIKLLIRQPIPKIRPGFILTLIFILAFGGVFLFQQIQPRVYFERSMEPRETRASTIETFREYGYWLKSRIPRIKTAYLAADSFVGKKLARGYRIISWPFTKVYKSIVTPEEKIIPEEKPRIEEESEPLEVEEGIVVVPSTGEDEETKRRIKEAFSDEVKVELKDETSGIIIPIFKEREGEKYLYMMVPVKD
jgi:hypothetical protein